MWQGEGGASEREGLESNAAEGREEMYADMGTGGDSLQGEETLEGVEMGVRVSAKTFVGGDEVREKDVFSITDETWLRRGREEMED